MLIEKWALFGVRKSDNFEIKTDKGKVMADNVVVNPSAWKQDDLETLFGDEEVHFTNFTDLPSLMVELGIFPSKSKARHANRQGDIPTGFTDKFKASKKRMLWIWNPTE